MYSKFWGFFYCEGETESRLGRISYFCMVLIIEEFGVWVLVTLVSLLQVLT